jgi:HAD superfamily hydrolase (TIGR01509 family)
MLKALIFDVDGTLADTERFGHRVAFNLAFAEAGLNWHWDENLYGDLLAVAGGKQRIAHFIACYQPEMPATADLPTFIKELQAIKNHHYAQLLKTGQIPARLGVIRLITEAKNAGLRLAIATTTMAENVAALFATAFPKEMLSWFEVIATDESVLQKKPAPDVYQYVLEKMQLSPRECLAIEDSQQGLQSALSANIATLITLNDYTVHQNFSGALAVVNHLGEPEQPLTCLTQTALAKFKLVDMVTLRFLASTPQNKLTLPL